MTKPFKLVEEKGVITRKEYDALEFDDKMIYWQIDKNEFKLISELEDKHLQKAFFYAQSKELDFHNRYLLFFELADKLEEEGNRRGIQLKDLNTEFHKNKRKLAK
jgi:hypothetical protein